MNKDAYKDSLAEFEKTIEEKSGQKFMMKLYVTGASALSSKALANIRTFCEKHLHGCYELEVIDIYQHPEMLSEDQIITSPTLIKRLPLPLRKLIGAMADEEKIFAGLNIQVREEEKGKTPQT